MTLSGEEFLRRFCLHILPSRFVKIRYYGIYSSRFRTTILNDKQKMVIKPAETTIERIARLIGIDVRQCPCCKKGQLVQVAAATYSSTTGIGITDNNLMIEIATCSGGQELDCLKCSYTLKNRTRVPEKRNQYPEYNQMQ